VICDLSRLNEANVLVFSHPGMHHYHIVLPEIRLNVTEAMLFHMAASGLFTYIALRGGHDRNTFIFEMYDEELKKWVVEGYHGAIKKLVEGGGWTWHCECGMDHPVHLGKCPDRS